MSEGLRSLAICFPRTVRTNDHWRQRHPDVVRDAESRALARLWSGKATSTAATAAFDAEMAPYLEDPFRGSIERRVCTGDETALAAARMTPSDVGLVLVSTFYAETNDVGNSAHLVRALGAAGDASLARLPPAYNFEAACAGSVVGLQNACALVRAGEHDAVLVVVACRYSHVLDDADTLSWFLADGAGAFVVGRCPEGEGYLGGKTVHTAETCGAFTTDVVNRPGGRGALRMRAGPRTGELLRGYSEVHLRACCEGALQKAGVRLEDVAFFVFNTPTAWFAAFAARALGVDPARTISVYPRYANVGPALVPANLLHAAAEGRIRRGDLVLCYAVGSVSAASAVVMRWGDVALGPLPLGRAPSPEEIRP